SVDFFRGPAFLVNRKHSLLEIHARFDTAQHFVGSPKNPAEEIELVLKQFVNSPVGLIPFVEEVDDHYIVFLAVTMAATDTLLDPLRIPRKIVVYHEG